MHLRYARRAFVAILSASALMMAPLQAAGGSSGSSRSNQEKKAKPSVAVKVTPTMGFSPARVVVTAELRGGADDYEQFYCGSVEWDWGDDTKSESKTDCEPYEAGKSEIKRRFTIEHTYNIGGEYRVEFRLKQKDKVVARGSADVKIRPGIRDGGDR